MNQLRGERSAQWLSDRTDELGHRVSRSTISDLETGRRARLEVAELLVLAAALDVPPLLLLYPEVPDGMVEVLPGVFASSEEAFQWACGEEHLRGRNREGETVFHTSGREPVELLQAIRELREMAGVDMANTELAIALDKVHADYRDQELMARVRKEFDEHDRRVELIKNRIRELGGTIIDPDPQCGPEGAQPPF